MHLRFFRNRFRRTRCLGPFLIAAAGFVALFQPFTASPAPAVIVEAGPFERRQVVTRFSVPPRTAEFVLSRKGTNFPVQLSPDGTATFILEHLPAGQSVTFSVIPTSNSPATPPARIQAERTGQRIELKRRGAVSSSETAVSATPSDLLLAYQAEPAPFPRDNIKDLFRRDGYLHPIRAPNGVVVTDDFPVNHIHHHGVWAAWTKTEFQGRHPDFWNMGDGTGRVEFESVDRTWNGPIHAGLQARHRYVDLLSKPPTTALNERWTLTVYAAPADPEGTWYCDLEIEQNLATKDPLHLPEYRYGGIGLRGNWAWNGPTNTLFLTSEGETDRDKGNLSRGRWCDMSGLVDGAHAGIAILGHTANFRAPEPMRLHPTEPFFCFAPQQAGDMEISQGKPYMMRYRLVVHSGAPKASELNRIWNDYVHPPLARFVASNPGER